MRLLLLSATYTTPAASAATLEGELNVAAVPRPLERGVLLPLPAKLVTFHTQKGSALSPVTAQFAGTMQGVEGAGVPPGQKFPAGHSVEAGDTEPAAQPVPGAPLQAPEQVGLERFTAAP